MSREEAKEIALLGRKLGIETSAIASVHDDKNSPHWVRFYLPAPEHGPNYVTPVDVAGVAGAVRMLVDRVRTLP